MASKTGNAARRATLGKKGGFERATDSPRFIPTAGGTRAHVYLPDGTSVFVKVGSEEFLGAVSKLAEAEDKQYAAQQAEFASKYPGLGWDAVPAPAEVADDNA